MITNSNLHFTILQEIIDNGFGVSPWYLRNGNDRLIGYYNEPPFLQQNILNMRLRKHLK